ncbi:MAG TPA: hypothetical protein VGO58_07510 [Chitinophagaceae bacterium]|jgi:hypothetical protein|nr:hypothetical protein [Chitinophagaceae bacterium]
MKQLFPFFLFFIVSTVVNGQGLDTSGRQAPASWKKMELAPRVAFGIQRAFYLEGGLALQRFIYDSRHGFVANTIYTCFEWTPGRKDSQSVYGVKAGAESVFNGGTGGIELKYLTNGDKEDFIITPKFGFGIGTVTLFYGYNISTNKYPFDRVRKHQFSLAINTNLLFYHSKYEKK